MSRRLFPLLFLFVCTSAALAQFGSSSSQPGVKLRGRSFAELYAAQKVLLSNYCRLDFEGARLEPAGLESLQTVYLFAHQSGIYTAWSS